jgi:hypothetical protein
VWRSDYIEVSKLIEYMRALAAFLIFCCCNSAICQRLTLVQNEANSYNGIEYGFIVNNHQLKEAGNDTFSRYEITCYISNKSNCTQLFGSRPVQSSYDNQNLLATFNCTNANGKRFTAKQTQIKARDWYITLWKKEGDKEVAETVKAGFIFRMGETLRSNIIVWVPRGDPPNMVCDINNLPPLQ